MGEKVITMLVNLLVMLFIARSLGPERFGQLSYFLALIMLVGPLSQLGLNALVTRELVERPQEEARIMATAAGLRLIGAVLGFLLLMGWVLLSASIVHTEYLMALAVLAAANSVMTAFSVVDFYFHAIVAARYVVWVRTATMLMAAIAKVWVLWRTGSLFWLLMVFAVEFALLSLALVSIYRFKSMGFRWRSFNWQYGKGLLAQSVWLILSSIAAAFYLKIDQVMLAEMVGHVAVGHYAVAARLSEVWYFFAEALVVSFFPMLLALKTSQFTQYQERLQFLCDGLFMAALVLAIAVVFMGKPVILWLFGNAYAPAVSILVIHIWAGIFVFMRALASKWLIAERLLVFSLVSHGVGAVINVVGNYLLIPLYGGEGAAIGTVVSYAAASYVAFWLSSQTRPIAKIMTRSLLLPVTFGARYWPYLRRKT